MMIYECECNQFNMLDYNIRREKQLILVKRKGLILYTPPLPSFPLLCPTPDIYGPISTACFRSI